MLAAMYTCSTGQRLCGLRRTPVRSLRGYRVDAVTQEAATADRALPDFRRSSGIVDLAALDPTADNDALAAAEGAANGVGARAQGSLRADGSGAAPPLGYDAAQVAGYAATRLPATYAVLLKARTQWCILSLLSCIDRGTFNFATVV